MSSPATAPPASSSIPTDAFTSVAAPSPTTTGSSGGGPSSSLYLFTFLATLFLLLFVSSAIILRSIVLRRRFRRRLEEAILGGVIPHNPTGRVSRRRAIGEKPKLWEAHVTHTSDDRWDAIIPVSVVSKNGSSGKHTKPNNIGAIADADDAHPHVHVDPGDGAAAATAAAPYPLPTHSPPRPRPPLYRRLWPSSPLSFSFPTRRRRGASVSSSSTLGTALRPMAEPASSEGGPSYPTHDDRLQVTVLIAMPDPRRPHLDRMVSPGHTKGKERSLDLDYEDDLPGMALGMTELLYGDAITTPKAT